MVMISSYENYVEPARERQRRAVLARQARFRQPQDQGRLLDRGDLLDPPPPGVPQRQPVHRHQDRHVHARCISPSWCRRCCSPSSTASRRRPRSRSSRDRGRPERARRRGAVNDVAVSIIAAVAENGVIGDGGAHALAAVDRPEALQGADPGQAGDHGPEDLRIDRQAARRPGQHRRLAAAGLPRRRASRSPPRSTRRWPQRGPRRGRPASTRSWSSAAARSTRRRCLAPTGSTSPMSRRAGGRHAFPGDRSRRLAQGLRGRRARGREGHRGDHLRRLRAPRPRSRPVDSRPVAAPIGRRSQQARPRHGRAGVERPG